MQNIPTSFWKDHVTARVMLTLFFGIVLTVGAIVAKDYAIPTDEPNMRELAEEAYDVVFRGGEWPESLARKYHGALVEFTIATAERASGLHGIATVTVLRHIITFLFFVAGVGAFAALCSRVFRDWKMGLLGAAFLVVSPRIFAHTFINSRDIPHLALFTIAVAALLRFLDRKTIGNALLLGFTCAADIAVRSMGILLVPLVIVGIVLDAMTCTGRACLATTKRMIVPVIACAATSAAGTIALWPLLWTDPIGNFLGALRFSSSFGGGGLYFGERLSTMPWHYVFVWIGITTPPLFTLLFLAGFAVMLRQLLGNVREVPSHRADVLAILWFLIPVVPVMFGAGIYNEWRHLFFIYPAFLFIALRGFVFLRDSTKQWKHILTAAVLGSIAWTGAWMWINHPLQNLYFSVPARFVQGNFDMDYWGLTSRKAIEAIVAIDRRPKIAMRVTNNITLINAKTFFPAKILFGTEDDDRADYIIDTSSEQRYAKVLPPEDLLTVIGPNGLRAASVYIGPALKMRLQKSGDL